MRALAFAGLWAFSAAAIAAGDRAATIYTCVDDSGKKLTSDRPIPECVAREQRLLNRDGSTRERLPPTRTAEEQAAYEARERQAAVERAAQLDAARRDRNLRLRYPDEAAHNRARASALDDVKKSIDVSEKRLAALAAERKPLLAEAEFYKGKALPRKLKQQLDGNDAGTDAQRTLIQNAHAEMVRINTNFDAELARLQKLWAGLPDGSPAPRLSPTASSSAAR